MLKAKILPSARAIEFPSTSRFSTPVNQRNGETTTGSQIGQIPETAFVGGRVATGFVLATPPSVVVLRNAAAVVAQDDRARDRFRVYVEKKYFLLFWWMINVFRGCEIAFLTAMTWLYYWLLNNPDQQVDSINNLSFDVSLSTLEIMNWTFVYINVLQILLLVNSLVNSVKARQLTFSNNTPSSTSPSVSSQQTLGGVRKAWKFAKDRYLEPVFYIHGKYFDIYFLFREYLEVLSQVYQAYQMSVYIATRWINNLFVAMIFINCISTPVIHWIVPNSNVPLRRLLSVTCSAFLNFVNSVVIPLIIFLPYPPKFNTTWGTFDLKYAYNDVWFTRAVGENQQLFITSYVDFCATWMPHWSQFSCLLLCQDLVRRQKRKPVVRKNAMQGTSFVSRLPHPKTRHFLSHQTRSPSMRFIAKLSRTHEFLVYNGLWMIGIIVLAIHIASQRPPHVVGCQLQRTPWFVTLSSCANLNINCYRREIEGNETEIADILMKVNTHALFSLIISHCTKLQIPSIIRDFPRLGGMDLYNDTVDSWPINASLRQEYHPNVVYIDTYLMNWTRIPDGMLADDLPMQLHEIRVYRSNLAFLGDNVDTSWQNLMLMFLDYCQLEEFPSKLTTLPLSQLTLRGNKFTSIDPNVFKMKDLHALILSNSTTLAELPMDIPLEGEEEDTMDQLVQLELEYTQVLHVPKYIRQWFLRKWNDQEEVIHSLYGSPYCNPLDADDEDEEERFYRSQVCASDHGSAGELDVFDLVVAQRPL